MINITTKLEHFGQNHCLKFLEELTAEEKEELYEDLQAIDYEYVQHIFKASTSDHEAKSYAPEPVEDVQQAKNMTPELKAEWEKIGLELVANGKLGIILLAGGQGTRLGSSDPKGCYNIGLPSGKSLFQLQAEKIARLQVIAKERFPSNPNPPVRWYIMTSKFTHQPTVDFFGAHDFFGLKEEQIMFFQQGFLPCLTSEGKIIMETKSKVAQAPDGNGGLYIGLDNSGALKDMETRGLECVDCYCVDNCLARMGDPLFVGYCSKAGCQAGARVVAKAYPEEKVGVFAKAGTGVQVIEYSELDPAEAKAKDSATGMLKYNWSNICQHYFEVSWLRSVSTLLKTEGRYHVANKQIPSLGSKVPGIKLELFIFDTFPHASSFGLFEVFRNEQFSPLKNAPGSGSDCPETARDDMLQLHKKWVEAAGGKVEGNGVEVSPLVSYAGEGLKEKCEGKSFGT